MKTSTVLGPKNALFTKGARIAAFVIGTSISINASAALIAPNATIALAPGSGWSSFLVNETSVGNPLSWINDSGSALSFNFTIAAGTVGTLTVVDGGYAGDTFSVFNGAASLGNTSNVALNSPDFSVPGISSFDLALANTSFSRGIYTFNAGSYSINGLLNQSTLIGLDRLDATEGAVRVDVSPVPEPSQVALMLAGLGVMGFVLRRRTK